MVPPRWYEGSGGQWSRPSVRDARRGNRPWRTPRDDRKWRIRHARPSEDGRTVERGSRTPHVTKRRNGFEKAPSIPGLSCVIRTRTWRSLRAPSDLHSMLKSVLPSTKQHVARDPDTGSRADELPRPAWGSACQNARRTRPSRWRPCRPHGRPDPPARGKEGGCAPFGP
jgi:hypothetical protein